MNNAKPDVKGSAPAKAPHPQKPPFVKPGTPPAGASSDYSGIVRILGRDIPGEFPLERALARVKGIGENLAVNFSRIIERKLGIPRSKRAGDLGEADIAKIEAVLKNPMENGIPAFQLNRQRDPETGKHRHVLQADLTFSRQQDIQAEKDARTYRGWRHSIGQRVRGQRTRNTGRTGMTMGVLKKAAKQVKTPGAEEGKAEKK